MTLPFFSGQTAADLIAGIAKPALGDTVGNFLSNDTLKSSLSNTFGHFLSTANDVSGQLLFDTSTGNSRQTDSQINSQLGSFSPDISGYTFILMLPPDLSGVSSSSIVSEISRICSDMVFLGLDFTPPAITINTEAVNTQASVSMPYATTKIATGEMSITFLDNSKQDINALHNLWVEYLYNQLWGDIVPAAKYITPGDPAFGALDYATSLYVLKYDAAGGNTKGDGLPSMVGKATGIFPTGLPVKETFGSRSANELVMQTINYTCSYFEVIHPRSGVPVASEGAQGTIWDEVQNILTKQYGKAFGFFG